MISYADYVINVSSDLTRLLGNKHKHFKHKFVTINNGFDENDFSACEVNDKNFNMIYTGSLSNKRIEALELLADAIISLNDSFINNNFILNIYSNFDPSKFCSRYANLINKNIFFNNLVSPKEVVSIISKHRYAFSINSKFASYAFGTKIFDYMALNRKILHISNHGQLYSILKNKDQFVSDYSQASIEKTLLLMKKDFLENKNYEQKSYSEYCIKSLTLKLEKLFI